MSLQPEVLPLQKVLHKVVKGMCDTHTNMKIIWDALDPFPLHQRQQPVIRVVQITPWIHLIPPETENTAQQALNCGTEKFCLTLLSA